ncbi:hypothetical protein JCM11641_007940 [Rhodosporidiobolus odoratus]
MNFSTFASNLLASNAPSQAPLFYSTRTNLAPRTQFDESTDDILGAFYGSEPPTQPSRDRNSSFSSQDSTSRPSSPTTESTRPPTQPRRVAAGGASHLAAVPAFVTRLGRSALPTSRGWKAYESLAAPPVDDRRAFSSGEDTDEDDDGPLPGAFVSIPHASTSRRPAPLPANALDEPLLGKRTLFVYPIPGPGGGVNARDRYTDSGWIAIYGVALSAVLVLAFRTWYSAPPLPAGVPSASLFSTLPTLSLLSLISVVAGAATLGYILTIQHALATLMTLSIFGGPLLCAGTGVVAFAGSFSRVGVSSDTGWKAGVRWFAVLCFVIAFVLGRTALSKRKQLNRAAMVGELACQTILSHPPLILLALTLSLASTVVTLPLISLITNLLAHTPDSPALAGWGAALTLLVYLWTLAIGRGLSHAVVGGCIGTWYFEREGEEYKGPLEVTKASLARATGPSFGTIIAASFFIAVFESLSVFLRAIERGLRSSRLPNLLRPFTISAPFFAAMAGYAAFFNSYSLSYAGMTGENCWSSSREVAALLRANRARNIRDTALLRLTLFISSTGWGLLAGLLAFFLASNQLDAHSGSFAPMLAVLSYAIPMYTVKLCHNLISDAVDALFVATHLDAENQLSHCPKAVEAFGQPEAESLHSFV